MVRTVSLESQGRARALALPVADQECKVVGIGAPRRVAAPASAVAVALARELERRSSREVKWLVVHNAPGTVTVARAAASSGRVKAEYSPSDADREAFTTAVKRARSAFLAHARAASETGATLRSQIKHASVSPRHPSLADVILQRAEPLASPRPRDTSARDALLVSPWRPRSERYADPFGRSPIEPASLRSTKRRVTVVTDKYRTDPTHFLDAVSWSVGRSAFGHSL